MANRKSTFKVSLVALALATLGVTHAQAAGGTTQGLGLAAATASLQPAAASSLVVNVAGMESRGEFGDAGNQTLTFNVGANTQIIGLSWDVTLTANDPSWLSEMQLISSNSGVSDGVISTFGGEVDDSGTQRFTGSADLIELGLNYSVGADGVLRLEFAESYVDEEVTPNGIWNSGTVTFQMMTTSPVPEPASYGLMALGLGALGVVARRRKTAA